MSMIVAPLGKALGAEVTGIDLSVVPPRGDLEALREALRDALVLIVRDQTLDAESLLAAARLFGETMEQHLSGVLMEGHPEIAVLDSRAIPPDPTGRRIPFGARAWHTDHTNHLRPPKTTVLYAVALPRTGGDTSFANMHLGYEALPPSRRAALDGLRTVNAIEGYGYIDEDARKRFGTRPSHPLIRTHPETGRKAVYLHPGKTERIEGMTPEASSQLVRDLIADTISASNTYRHRWRVGDLLLCDNRAVMHRAHQDYDMAEGRVMHRVILRGDRPT